MSAQHTPTLRVERMKEGDYIVCSGEGRTFRAYAVALNPKAAKRALRDARAELAKAGSKT